MLEIDVLTAIALDLTMDELVVIYRVQFPVMQKYERRMLFDQRGMRVTVRNSHTGFVPNENHPDYPTMIPPFTPVNREADYREAWAYFERKLGER